MRTLRTAAVAAVVLALFMAWPVMAQITNFDTVVTSADLIVGDDATIGGLNRYVTASAITVTTDGTVTPTGTYQPLTAAGNVQTTGITVLSAGTIVHFVNTANVTITFTDTGTLKLSGNAALGQYDTLTLFSDGTNWIEVSETNN